MRILNRPMFRYGGPIREGVMHGMRNNYRSGQLVRPGPGRPGYQGPPKTKVGLAGWLATKLPWWSKIKTGTKDIIPKTIKKIRGSQPVEDMRGIFTQTGKGSGITSTPAATTFMQNLRSFPGVSKIPGWATKAKNLAATYPKSTLAGGYFGALPIAASLPYKKIGSTLVDVAKWPLSFLPGGDDEEGGDGTDKITKKIVATGPKPWEANEAMTYTDPDAAAKLAKKQQGERLKNYLDMMGYDSAKKGALSDALIDASALVQDATTEAGSIKKADWGNLINKMIQTTSKRLDKPEQIREAVGLMMTKGEIEKDIAAGKGTPLDLQERYYTSKLGKDGAERKMLGKPTSFIEALNRTKATDTKGDRTNQALMDYFDGYLTPTFKGKISKKKIDALGGTEVLKEGQSIGLDNGVYQISNSYIIVQGNKIIELTDVFGED